MTELKKDRDRTKKLTAVPVNCTPAQLRTFLYLAIMRASLMPPPLNIQFLDVSAPLVGVNLQNLKSEIFQVFRQIMCESLGLGKWREMSRGFMENRREQRVYLCEIDLICTSNYSECDHNECNVFSECLMATLDFC